jgi:putative membrane protein
MPKEKLMAEYYDWIKAFHLIAVISWMAGIFYLPRLFVYHCEVLPGSEEDKRFQTMERKLLKQIMNPAMIISIILGLWLAMIYGFKNLGIWFHIKFSLVILMVYFHHFLGKKRKEFEKGSNKNSAKFYRIINEAPTILMITIVILAIVKPF